MNETNRRRFCRVLFLLVAISPCCAVLAAAVWRNSAQADESWLASLRQSLGVDVNCNRVVYPAPGQVRWEGLRFFDVDSGELLAQIDVCLLTERDGRLHLAPVGVSVVAEHAEKLVHALRASFANTAASVVEFDPCEVSVIGANEQVVGQWSLTRAEVWSVESGRKALVRCKPVGGEEIALHVEQDQEKHALRVSLDTEDRALSLVTLNAFFPRLRVLGTASTFSGVLQLAQSTDGWNADVSGIVDQIDLEALVNRHTKQHLTGVGALEIAWAQFRNGKLVAAKGKFGATGGEIGVALLSDVSGGFQFPCVYSKEELDERRFETDGFSQLLVQFDLQKGAIEVTGLVEPGQSPLLNEDGNPILSAPVKRTRLSLAYAVQLLFPTGGTRIAAAHESFWLASWLPLPAASQMRDWIPPEKRPTESPSKNSLRQPKTRDP